MDVKIEILQQKIKELEKSLSAKELELKEVKEAMDTHLKGRGRQLCERGDIALEDQHHMMAGSDNDSARQISDFETTKADDDGFDLLTNALTLEKPDDNGIIVADQDLRSIKYAMSVTIHDKAESILDFLLTDDSSCRDFRRQTFRIANQNQSRSNVDTRVAIWQCTDPRGKTTVECKCASRRDERQRFCRRCIYLRLDTIITNTTSNYSNTLIYFIASDLILMKISSDQKVSISLESIDVEQTGDCELIMAAEDILSRSKGQIIRAKINRGCFTLTPMEYGQTILSFQGNIGVLDVLTQTDELKAIDDGFRSRTALLPKSSVTLLNKSSVAHGMMEGDLLRQICKSLYNVASKIEKKFSQPNIIDGRMRDEFKNGNLKNLSPLSGQERDMLKSLKTTEDMVRQGARRVARKITDRVEKFLIYQGDEVWGMTSTIVHTSAEDLFAHIWIIDTCKSAKQHRENNGNLPRKVWKKVGGNRGQQYR